MSCHVLMVDDNENDLLFTRIALQRSRVHDSKDLDPQSLALRETREHVTIASIVATAANDSQFPCHGPCGTQPP